MKWEYTTLKTRILIKVAKSDGVSYGSPDLPEDTQQELAKLGERGWEMVSVLPVNSAMFLGSSAGTRAAMIFLKRQQENMTES